MKYKVFNQPSILMATHSKPNVGIWQFPLLVMETFQIHFILYFTFWQIFTQKIQFVMIG
jgi:hypothetical protein